MIGRILRTGRGLRAQAKGEVDSFSFRLFEIAIELFALAVAMIGAAVAFRGSTAMPFLLVGSGCALGLSALVLVAAAHRSWGSFFALTIGWHRYEYIHRLGGLQHLDEVVTAGRKSIGDAHPDAEALTRQLAENHQILHVYGREREDGRFSFCGYIILYPLTDQTGSRILGGAIRSAGAFGDGSLSGDFGSAPYLYIGMVLGTDRHSQPQVTRELRMTLRMILRKGHVLKVFARPATPYGERLMKRYGFLPLGGDTDIWSISAQRLLANLWHEEGPEPAVLEGGNGSSQPALRPADGGQPAG